MKTSTITIAALGLLAVSSNAQPEAKKEATTEAVELFNGKNLRGWKHFLVKKGVKKSEVWSVKDGVLVCKGEPLGYLQTKESFESYRLELDWRWAPGGEPGNSGVLLRIEGKARSILPKCVEAQLQNGSAGDIWAFYGTKATGDKERAKTVKDHKLLGNFMGVGKIKAAEKKPGEWNHYDITLKGDTLHLKVNGELVNEASGLDVVSGPIGLQSEGGEIHFRNIRVTKL